MELTGLFLLSASEPNQDSLVDALVTEGSVLITMFAAVKTHSDVSFDDIIK